MIVLVYYKELTHYIIRLVKTLTSRLD